MVGWGDLRFHYNEKRERVFQFRTDLTKTKLKRKRDYNLPNSQKLQTPTNTQIVNKIITLQRFYYILAETFRLLI